MAGDQERDFSDVDSVGEELAAWMDHLPGVDSRVESASERIRRISRLLGRILTDTARQNEMTVGDWESLSVLKRSGPSHEISQKELAEKLGVTSGTISVRVDRLMDAGLIEPGSSRQDGRSRPVKLTEKGSRLWRTATEQRTKTEHSIYTDTYGGNDLEQLNLLLGKLLARFEKELGAAPSHGSLRREADRAG